MELKLDYIDKDEKYIDFTQKNIDLINFIIKEKHASTNLITFVKDRINHDTLYHVNDQKLRSLGWNPIHNIKDEICTL